jgi:hypothetical protein
LDDRFRLLTSGTRTALPRQQTLLASVQWSYALLDDVEQTLLRQLAVFAAPFTIEAAEAIAADEGFDRLEVFDLVSRLVDKSLVQRVGERCRLLETIRQFALDHAGDQGELEGLRDAHLCWFRNRVGRWRVDHEIVTDVIVAEIGLESPDLIAALDWSLRPGSDPAVELLWPLGWRWVVESAFAEAARISRAVLAHFEIGSPAWLDTLAPMASALLIGGDRSWIAPAHAALAERGETIGDQTRGYLQWAAHSGPVILHDPEALTSLRSAMQLGRRTESSALELGAATFLAVACAAGGAVQDARPLCDWLDRRLPGDAGIRSNLDVARSHLALHRCDFETAWSCVSDRARRRPPDLPSAVLAGLVGFYTEDQDRLAVGLEAYEWTAAPGAYGLWRQLLRVFREILDGRLDEAWGQLESLTEAPGFERQSPVFERLRIQLGLATGNADAAIALSREIEPQLGGPLSLRRFRREMAAFGVDHLALTEERHAGGRRADAVPIAVQGATGRSWRSSW